MRKRLLGVGIVAASAASAVTLVLLVGALLAVIYAGGKDHLPWSFLVEAPREGRATIAYRKITRWMIGSAGARWLFLAAMLVRGVMLL